MALTRRARRRIMLLLGISLILVVLVGTAWVVRQRSRGAQAEQAWQQGLIATEDGRWSEALPDLSLAVAYKAEDVERVLLLAEARSRVPEEGNRHLSTALGYFGRALQLARMQGGDPESVRVALLGKARLQMTLRSLVELRKTVDQLLEIDPLDRDGLEYMLTIKQARGDFLPADARLLARGNLSQEAWLEEYRIADEDCALRWALELDLLDLGSVESRTRILEILENADSIDQQRVMGTGLVESPLDLAEAWAVESGLDDANPFLVKAMAALRVTEPGAARKALEEAELAGLDDAKKLLAAASILEYFRTNIDVRRAQKLIEEAERLAVADGAIAMALAIRSWNKGGLEDCVRQIDIGLSADDASGVDLNLYRVLVAFASRMENRDETLEDFRRFISSSSADPAERVILQAVSGFLGLVSEGNQAIGELDNAIALLGSFSQRAIVQVILGDLFDEMGLGQAALASWQAAFDNSGGKSLPIGRRVVSGYLLAGQPDKALEQGIRFFEGTQSIAGLIAISQAWSAVNAQGLDADGISPELARYGFESPSAMVEMIISEIEQSSGDTNPYLPMLVKALIEEQRLDQARATIEGALSSSCSGTVLIRLAELSESADLGFGMRLLDAAVASSADEKLIDQMTVARSAFLRKQGDLDGAMELISTRFGDRTDDDSRRFLLLEQISDELERGVSPEARITTLIEEDLCGIRLLKRLHGIAISEELSDSSQRIVLKLGEVAGLDSPVIVLAEARHVLEFESDIPEAVRKAVIRADQVVNARMASADLHVALVRLLRLEPEGNRDRCLELLRSCVLLYPGRFDVQILLTQIYQETGQLEEAENILQALVARRDSAPDGIKAMLPRLLEGQGDVDEIAISRCEIADRTGNPTDCLECIRALGRADREEEASRRLDDLIERSILLPGIEMEIAARFLRKGDVTSAIDWLAASEAFENELAKAVAIAKILDLVGRWGDVAELLGPLDERGIANSNSKWLLAQSELQSETPNFPMALVRLREAYQLAEDSPVDLVRILTTYLQTPGLAADPVEIDEMLVRLGTIQPATTDTLRLAFDATDQDGRFRHSDDLVDRSLQLARQQRYNTTAWRLAADIHLAAFTHWFEEIDSVETNRAAAALADLLREAVTLFPANPSFNSRLAVILFEIGRREEAVAVLRQGMRNVGKSLSLGQALRAARILLVTDGPQAVLEVLEPFRGEIESGPKERIKSWSLLVESLLLAGSVDEAWEIYSRGPYDLAKIGGLVPWLSMVEGLDGPAAMLALDKAEILSADLDFALFKTGTMVKVYRTTLDPGIRDRVDRMISTLLGADLPQGARLNLAMLENNLAEIDDLMAGIDGYKELLQTLPQGIADDLVRFADLDEARMQELAPFANFFVMATNNRIALLSKAIFTEELPPDEVPSVVSEILEASSKLGAIVPDSAEVMDTRALVALAAEDAAGARDLAEAASRLVPRNGNFRFTLAQAMLANGQLEAARLQALESVRLLLLAMNPDDSKIEEVREFIAGIE